MEYVFLADGPYLNFEGQKYLDCSSSDFLGLSKHPEIKKGSIKYTLKYGVGFPQLPLLFFPQLELETKLAHLLGTETCLLFPTFSEIQSLLNQKNIPIYTWPLEEAPSNPSLSSQPLCFDDTMTFGLKGHQGFGNSAHQQDIDIILGSFSYSIGCSGAYMAGKSRFLKQFVPSSSLSAPILGAIDCALNLIPEMEEERQILKNHSMWLAKELKQYPTNSIEIPQQTLEFRSSEDVFLARQLFKDHQIFLLPPQNGRSLSILLTALHTPDDLDQLSQCFRKLLATNLDLVIQSLTPIP